MNITFLRTASIFYVLEKLWLKVYLKLSAIQLIATVNAFNNYTWLRAAVKWIYCLILMRGLQ